MESLALDRVARDLRELADQPADSHSLRHEVVERLRRVVPVDAYCFAEVDPESQMMIAHATDGINRRLSPMLYINEYMQDDFVKHASLIDGPRRARSLSEATAGQLHRSPRYRDLLAPMGVGHELRAACVEDGQAWGMLHLYRAPRRLDFTPAEAALIGRSSALLARLIRSAVLRPGVTSVAGGVAPAVVVLDPDNGLAEATGEAAERLEDLRDPEEAGSGHTPEVLQTLATRARAQACGDSVPCARLRSRTGTWFLLHASCLSGADPGRERVAVVISPASAPDLRPLVFSQHRLSAGEREVTALVLAGRSTKEIAGELYISPYTVQDRLKAIFEKFGVRSRRELVARVNTGRPRGQEATVSTD